MRQRALAGDCGACSGGLGILVGQGMGAWIEVCSQLLPVPLPPPRASSAPPPPLASTVERELVVMVTQMILSTAKELVA
ncbi:MAG TPA: hypothetical protein VNB06_05880 [Thermoanaerobaculia bacterium]|nr:hypothetical protein [Thermoanaerobaculia bacterium]